MVVSTPYVDARVEILVTFRFLSRVFPLRFMSLFLVIFFSASVFSSHFPSSLASAHCIVEFLHGFYATSLNPVSARRGDIKPVVSSQLHR